jgi:hypothetical protein
MGHFGKPPGEPSMHNDERNTLPIKLKPAALYLRLSKQRFVLLRVSVT